jgi:putative ABC transport system permease protein
MFKNYLDVALRSLLANKLFSCINVFGLAVGLASAILLGLYVANELSYDRFHPAGERVYRIGRDFYPRDDFDGLHLATVPAIAAGQLEQDYPELEVVARAGLNPGLLGYGERVFYESAILHADPALLDLFRFEWLAGDPATALAQPESIVLTESLARKYFGAESPLGQSLTYENRTELQVTGLIRDLPENTHLRADALRPMVALLNALPESLRSDWGPNIMHTYARVAPGTDVAALAATFPAFIDRHIPPAAGRDRSSPFTGITATPVSAIHLQSMRQNEMSEPGSMATVLALAAVAIGIVAIACFNFMNLATARSVQRAKEVGIRKTVGAERQHLVLQFLGESFGMVLLSLLIAIMLVEVTLPGFNGFSGKTLAFNVLDDLRLQGALVVLAIVVGVGAGFYPALYLSAFNPARVLKSRVSFGLRGVVLRNLLVVLQFSISIVLVSATAVVGLQMRYVRSFDPGFDKEQVVVLAGSPTAGLTERWPALREELLRHPGIASVTASNLVPGVENLIGIQARVQGAPESAANDMATMIVDYGFLETYRVALLAGRAFSADFAGDLLPTGAAREKAANFMLNAAAARTFGWTPEQAVGQLIQTGRDGGNTVRGQVVGVVADSNFESLRFSAQPLLFLLGQQGPPPNAMFSAAAIRVTGADLPSTLAHIDTAWKNIIPEFPLSRRFLSDDFEALYQDDTRLGQLFSSFAALAILIACLGLFGLATFNAQRRIKEIGVRKVMGGSVLSIVWLLTNDFSKLVLVSNVIAWPLAYVAMERWLENFAYRIDLTPLVFIGSGLIALCIAWVTVGGTAAKAARQKPVLALRYE